MMLHIVIRSSTSGDFMDSSLKDLYLELPGTEDLPPPPWKLFEKLRESRGENYRPRTRHMRGAGRAKYTNLLFLETSPYLLQHAHNPVNWFPWGNEAFDLASQLGRPVLVSIGYATCHWCHVMEEESFEDEKIASFLNRNFIAIKVDREERPDIDTIYMSALHAMGVQGGWPLNVFVTSEKKPFYGGTYFPPYDNSRGIGFLSLLRRLGEVYQANPERLIQAGLQLTEAVQSMLAPAQRVASAQNVSLDLVVQSYRDRFDSINGGVLGAPKFPSSLPVRLLLRQYSRNRDRNILSMAALTLRRIAAGGIYDQIGGGFHRYATDEGWLIPHFEKMLYDNVLLAITYLEGHQLTGDGDLAEVVRQILRYLQREMTSPEGGLYSATDADSLTSEGKRDEGFFFTWTPEEVIASLGRECGEIVAAYYGIKNPGNFEGRSIPHREKTTAEVARELNLSEESVQEIVEQSREVLYQTRSHRPLPLRDEKILASWNGLAISAFARAGLILNQSDAVDQSCKTARFVLDNMTIGGRLTHSHQEGGPKGEGFLDDYAFCIAGLVDLFEITGEVLWLERSLQLTAVVQDEFADLAEGGYFMTGSRHEKLIAREKPAYDGVVPSGNSVMVMNLLRLNGLTEEPRFLDQAKAVLNAFGSRLSSAPSALTEMLLALDFLQDVQKQIVIVAPHGNRQAADGLLQKFRQLFLANRSLVIVCEGGELDRASELVPVLKGKKANGNLAVAYLCENRTCRAPTSDPEEFGRQLAEIGQRN